MDHELKCPDCSKDYKINELNSVKVNVGYLDLKCPKCSNKLGELSYPID